MRNTPFEMLFYRYSICLIFRTLVIFGTTPSKNMAKTIFFEEPFDPLKCSRSSLFLQAVFGLYLIFLQVLTGIFGSIL